MEKILDLRVAHRTLGLGIAAFIVLIAATGAWMQVDTLRFKRSWSAQKQILLQDKPASVVQARTLALSKTLEKFLRNPPADLSLAALYKVEYFPLGEAPKLSLQFLAEKTIQVNLDPSSGAILSRETLSGPSLLLKLHTGEILGIPGIYFSLLITALFFILVVSGVGLSYRVLAAKSEKTP